LPEQLSLKERILSGPILYGPSLLSMSPAVVEVAALAGCDFVWIEVEHSGIDMMQIENMCRAAELRGILSLTRVPDGSRPSVLRNLEAGAKIILTPQIHTAQQAAAVAEFGKFPPIGKRGFNTGSRGLGYGTLASTAEEVFAIANRETIIMVQIESVEALENLDAIAAIEGIDGLFFGPGDTSADMGIPAQWDNEDLVAAGERVIQAARANSKISSSTCPTPEMTKRWQQAGVNILISGGDVGTLRTGFADKIAELKAL